MILLSSVFASPLIDLGDRLWCQGDYKEANTHWKEASNSSDPATVAMSHYRRILTASNLGWAVRGVLADTSLDKCALNDPQCALANVDREIFLSFLGLPADLKFANELAYKLLPHIPAAATARLVWFGDVPASALQEIKVLDGFGECMQQSTTWDRGPGGAYFGFGLYGGGRLGIGGSASWTQPNIDNNGGQLQTSVALTTQKAGGIYLSYTSVGKRWVQVNSSAQRRPFFRYQSTTPTFNLVEIASAAIKPGWTWDSGQIWVGPFARIEGVPIGEQDWRAIGLQSGLIWKPYNSLQIRSGIEYTEWNYHHLRMDAQLMWIHKSGLATLIDFSSTPNTEAPWWRLPTVGGGTILRTAPAHRWRDEFLPAMVLEYRWKPENTFGVVPFAEVAYANDSLHGGGGIGIRLRLPPQPQNTMRFDIGYGDSGWNILFGAEEFFRFGLF